MPSTSPHRRAVVKAARTRASSQSTRVINALSVMFCSARQSSLWALITRVDRFMLHCCVRSQACSVDSQRCPPPSVCHHPRPRFTRVITLREACARRNGTPRAAMHHRRASSPLSAASRRLSMPAAPSQARSISATSSRAEIYAISGWSCAPPKDTLKRSHHRITLRTASVSASWGTA